MKLLLACMEYNYGDPARGRSYEYYNFYLSLKQMGVDVRLFDFYAEMQKLGKEEMNRKLVATVKEWQPDVTLFSLYTDQVLPETVERLKGRTKSLCFFHDDTWRVDFSRFWAPRFDFFTTPDVYGRQRYERLGLTNVIPFAFGVDPHLYARRENAEKKYDVSFVGAWHPWREWLVKRLRKSGVSVKTAGYRWPDGVVTQDEMIDIFNSSRINLNLSNSASWDARYLMASPRGLLNRLRTPKSVEQLKARHFEIGACGAFQLSYYVEGLERHFKIGDEIGIYLDADDLLIKTRLYLEDESLRESIAHAGHARVLASHTFESRFKTAFEKMGVIL
jgi:spore maturation protein CgeB